MNPNGTKCYTFTNHLDLREDFFCLGCENTDNIGNSEWQPIIDCREEMNLAVTPPGIMCKDWNKNLFNYFYHWRWYKQLLENHQVWSIKWQPTLETRFSRKNYKQSKWKGFSVGPIWNQIWGVKCFLVFIIILIIVFRVLTLDLSGALTDA